VGEERRRTVREWQKGKGLRKEKKPYAVKEGDQDVRAGTSTDGEGGGSGAPGLIPSAKNRRQKKIDAELHGDSRLKSIRRT
jgi:hypothetical protein